MANPQSSCKGPPEHHPSKTRLCHQLLPKRDLFQRGPDETFISKPPTTEPSPQPISDPSLSPPILLETPSDRPSFLAILTEELAQKPDTDSSPTIPLSNPHDPSFHDSSKEPTKPLTHRSSRITSGLPSSQRPNKHLILSPPLSNSRTTNSKHHFKPPDHYGQSY